METEVARKIENAIASLQGLKHITTKVQDGSTTISAGQTVVLTFTGSAMAYSSYDLWLT
jgi:multidrug efflux pump subunit AcrB